MERGDGEEMMVKYEVDDTIVLKGAIDYPNISVAQTDASGVIVLLEALADEIEETVNTDPDTANHVTTQIIGNGIYVTAPFPFRIDTPEKDIINVLSGTSEFNENWEQDKEADEEEQ